MIADFVLEGTPKTPSIKFSGKTGVLEISGKSIPENSVDFYRPMLNWIDSYSAEPLANTQVKIMLEYFNTSSSKCLLDIFRKLEALKKSGRSAVEVAWHYEDGDEDMMEAGDDYRSLVNLPFQIIQV